MARGVERPLRLAQTAATFTLVVKRPEWHARGACRDEDPGLFFARAGGAAQVDAAKAVCRRCQVIDECLAWALSTPDRRGVEPHGVWGGTTPEERRKLARHAGAAA